MAKTKKPKSTGEREMVRKWGSVIIDAGYTIVPSVLLQRQGALGLTSQELNVLLQLLEHGWAPDSYPFPARKRIAARMDCSVQTIQRHLTSLKTMGLIEIERRTRADGGYASNRYSFEGRKKALEPFAKDISGDRRKKHQEEEAAAKKRPSRAARKMRRGL